MFSWLAKRSPFLALFSAAAALLLFFLNNTLALDVTSKRQALESVLALRLQSRRFDELRESMRVVQENTLMLRSISTMDLWQKAKKDDTIWTERGAKKDVDFQVMMHLLEHQDVHLAFMRLESDATNLEVTLSQLTPDAGACRDAEGLLREARELGTIYQPASARLSSALADAKELWNATSQIEKFEDLVKPLLAKITAASTAVSGCEAKMELQASNQLKDARQKATLVQRLAFLLGALSALLSVVGMLPAVQMPSGPSWTREDD